MAQTYYEILELDKDNCTQLDIKRAYKKLALRSHPDRNPGTDTTEQFQRISEAYEVLSDPLRRAEYNQSLLGNHRIRIHDPQQSRYRPFSDPFVHFDDLFRNDPFFQDAFRDLDDEFARRYRNSTDRGQHSARPAKQGWGGWLLQCLGVDFQMTTTTIGPNGDATQTKFYSRPSSRTTTHQSARSFVDASGRRIELRSMEQNGNRIQDKLVDGVLVERTVNGVVESLEQTLIDY